MHPQLLIKMLLLLTSVHNSCMYTGLINFLESEVCEKFIQRWWFVCLLLFAISVILLALYLTPQQVTGKAAEWKVRVPPIPTAFTGREEEIQHIVDCLKQDVRILSITGGPGYGKSSVAIVSSHQLMELRIPVCYVSLSEADSIETFIVTLLHALTAKTERHPDELQVLSLVGLLWKKTVIVLDNVDQLTLKQTELRQDFIQLLKRIVAKSVYVHFVVVSRYRFNIISDFEDIHLQPLVSSQALSLLRSLIHASWYASNGELTEEKLQMITNETGGIPLAIKVVGRLVKSGALSVDEVLEELSIDPVSTLSEDSFTPDEQLKRCIDLSYKSLNRVGQRCFLYAARFPGSFDHKAKKTIIANLTGDVHCLRKLVDRSLVEYNGVTKRYNMHALLRAFANDHSGEKNVSLDSYYQLYANHYITVLTEKVRRTKTSGNVNNLYTILVVDYHNFLELFHILSADNPLPLIAYERQLELALEAFQILQSRFPREVLISWWTKLLENVCLTTASDFQSLALQSVQLSTKFARLLCYHQKYSLARFTLLSVYKCIHRDESLTKAFQMCQHPQLSTYTTMLQVLAHVSKKEGFLHEAHVFDESIRRCLRNASYMKAEEVIPHNFCSDGISYVREVHENFKDLTSALLLFDALLRCKEAEAVKIIKMIEEAFEKEFPSPQLPSTSTENIAALCIAKCMYQVADDEGEVKWLVRSSKYMQKQDYLAFSVYFRLSKLYWLFLNDKQKALKYGRAAYAAAKNLSPAHDLVWKASVRLADILNQIEGHNEEAAQYFEEALDHQPFINANPDIIYSYQRFIELNLVSFYFQSRQFGVFYQHFGQWAMLEAAQTPKDVRKIANLYYKMLNAQHAENSSLAIVDNSLHWHLKGLKTVWLYLNAHIRQTYDATTWYSRIALFGALGIIIVIICLPAVCFLAFICAIVCFGSVLSGIIDMLCVACVLVCSFHYFLYVAIVEHKVWKPRQFTVIFIGKVLWFVALFIFYWYACITLLFPATEAFHNLSMDISDDDVYIYCH